MHPINSTAFEYFWAELCKIASSKDMETMKKEGAVRVLDFARAVPAIFDPDIPVKKAKQATIKGAVSLAMAAVIYAALRGFVQPTLGHIGFQITPEQEQALVGFIALCIGSFFNGVLVWFSNWQKHRDDS